MNLPDDVQQELLELAASSTLREDMRALRRLRAERDRTMTPAEFVAFASAVNALAGHPFKPSRPFPEREMRL